MRTADVEEYKAIVKTLEIYCVEAARPMWKA